MVARRALVLLTAGLLAGCDPVEVGGELLAAKSESVKARALEIFVGWAYGATKSAAGADNGPGVRIIWDLPRPPHEKC